jgi:DNA mismatch endonuclease (patch repair protein)
MQEQRRRDTGPELTLRRRLHALGLRYLVDAEPLPGLGRRADLVFRGPRVAVFVDGCFWHGCPVHGTTPRSNTAWWRRKIEANVARDRDTDRRLAAAGWRVVRVWEHEAVEAAVDKVLGALRAAGCATPVPSACQALHGVGPRGPS